MDKSRENAWEYGKIERKCWGTWKNRKKMLGNMEKCKEYAGEYGNKKEIKDLCTKQCWKFPCFTTVHASYSKKTLISKMKIQFTYSHPKNEISPQTELFITPEKHASYPPTCVVLRKSPPLAEFSCLLHICRFLNMGDPQNHGFQCLKI